MVGVKVPIGSGLDTKDDLHIRKRHAERDNLSVSPIDDACNKTISLHSPDITPENTKVEEKGDFRMDTYL